MGGRQNASSERGRGPCRDTETLAGVSSELEERPPSVLSIEMTWSGTAVFFGLFVLQTGAFKPT